MSQDPVIELGTEAGVTFSIYNASGVLTNPATLGFQALNAASGVVASYAGDDAKVTHVSTGVYRLDLVPTSEDRWWGRVVATAPTVTHTEPFRVVDIP